MTPSRLLPLLVLLTLLGCPPRPSSALAQPPTPTPSLESLRIQLADPEESKRLEALHKLHALGSLDAPLLLRSLTDTSPSLRAETLRLGQPLATSDPEVALRFLALANDKSSVVRLRLLQLLPALPREQTSTPLLRILLAEAGNPKATPLALTSLPEDPFPFLATLLLHVRWKEKTKDKAAFLQAAADALCTPPASRAGALLDFAAQYPGLPPWTRTALLRGAFLGAPGSSPANLPKIQLPAPPKSLEPLIQTKENDEIRKILSTPNARIAWPQKP